jgi:hypothetical protein
MVRAARVVPVVLMAVARLQNRLNVGWSSPFIHLTSRGTATRNGAVKLNVDADVDATLHASPQHHSARLLRCRSAPQEPHGST